MRKLHVISNLYFNLGLHFLVRLLRAKKLGVPVLTYHRVIETSIDFPFDDGLISVTPAEFSKQMHYIKKRYNPISMEQYIDYIEYGSDLPKFPILITFDDGFDDNYFYAFPILKKLEIPATIFISTDFINSKEAIWYERLAYFFKRVKKDTIFINELDFNVELPDDLNKRSRAYCEVIELLKLVSNNKRLAIISNLFDKYGDPYHDSSTSEKSLSKPLSWDQINEMKGENIYIGSHTVSHPVLSQLDSESLILELTESKSILQMKISQDVRAIAYPVGQSESYSTQVIQETRNAGYSVAFTYIDNVSKYNIEDRFQIDRIHVELIDPFSLFCSKISFPELFCES